MDNASEWRKCMKRNILLGIMIVVGLIVSVGKFSLGSIPGYYIKEHSDKVVGQKEIQKNQIRFYFMAESDMLVEMSVQYLTKDDYKDIMECSDFIQTGYAEVLKQMGTYQLREREH